MGEVDLSSREAYCAGWGLFGEWWCVPVDMTESEKRAFLQRLRDNMGSDFCRCPLEYIEDRLFGGFECADCEDRRHVHFATGHYSFLAAEQGRYWPLPWSDTREVWHKLFEKNEGHIKGDGPFTNDWQRARETFR
jgi:hypothetical protein